MSDPVVLRIVRPYGSEREFLEKEAWTLDAKGALLLDQPALEPGTVVRFDVILASGERIIRAEGKVVKAVLATAARPGGLRVRFSRFGGSTKTLIDKVVAERQRIVAAQESAATEARSSVRAVPEPAAKPSDPAPRPIAPKPIESGLRPPPPKAEVAERTPTPPVESAPLQQSLRGRSVRQVTPPADRDALLERLRTRRRNVS